MQGRAPDICLVTLTGASDAAIETSWHQTIDCINVAKHGIIFDASRVTLTADLAGHVVDVIRYAIQHECAVAIVAPIGSPNDSLLTAIGVYANAQRGDTVVEATALCAQELASRKQGG